MRVTCWYSCIRTFMHTAADRFSLAEVIRFEPNSPLDSVVQLKLSTFWDCFRAKVRREGVRKLSRVEKRTMPDTLGIERRTTLTLTPEELSERSWFLVLWLQ